MAKSPTNSRKAEMKTWLFQIIYENPFWNLDQEDPFTHLSKFYELAGTLGASEAKEKSIFMILFPHSLIGKAKDWYIDHPEQIMTNWNILEEKLLNRLFPHNKSMDAKTTITVFA